MNARFIRVSAREVSGFSLQELACRQEALLLIALRASMAGQGVRRCKFPADMR